jgi:hypothetical protein
MPSKGPSGNTTVTQRNPTGEAQLPYLQQGWGQAKNLYEQIGGPRYFPGDTMAPYTAPSNYLNQGYQGIVNTALANDAGLRPQANNAWFNSLNNTGYANSPAYARMKTLAEGQDPDQAALRDQAGQAIASGNQYAQNLAGGNLGLSTLGNIAQGQGAGMEQLARAASGQYLNSNPYLDKMAQAAMDPVTRNYQTSTAPTLAAQMSRSGRYGSGALVGAQGQNEQNLGKTLADMSANLYGTNYANERARQDAAANQYAGLQTQAGGTYGQQYGANQTNAANAAMAGYGRSAANIGADLTAQGAGISGLQGAYQAGNANQLSALQQYPNMLNSQYGASDALIKAGQGFTGIDDQLRQQQQAGINDQMNRWNATQMEPFKDLQLYNQNIGAPNSAGQSTTTPYFQNDFASALSGAAGLKSLLGGGGLGGLGGAASNLGGYTAGLGSYASPFSGATYDLGLANMIGLTNSAPAAAAAGAGAAGGGGLLSGIGSALSKL